MTKHNPPRVANKGGECRWPAPDLPIADSIRIGSWQRAGLRVYLELKRNTIWPDSGAACPVWSPKSGEAAPERAGGEAG